MRRSVAIALAALVAAGCSKEEEIPAPKPPPIRGLMTRILLFGIPNAVAIFLRTWKGICVAL